MADFARGERLRELREGRHLSQEDAAHEIGVSVKTVRSWEHGGGIRWENAKTAAGFYKVNPESLVAREPGRAETVPLSDSQLDRLEQKVDEILDRLDAAATEREIERAEPEPRPAARPRARKRPATGSR